ncbi:MAG TPA: BCCT family transporter [Clostridiales bacterium]|nr:BCCT family transporter [Clostridiales bacterium]
MKTQKIDYVTIVVSVALLALLVISTIASPELVVTSLVSAKDFVIYYLGSFFIVFVAAMLFYNIWLAFSKYGSIRLGKVKPQYSTFGWIAMIFCAAMGTSILFWSAIEWAYYVTWLRPFGLDMQETADIAVAYSFFHWGIPAWSVYATGVVPIAYRYFVRKKEGLTIQGACEGVLGNKVYGPLGTVINIVFIFGILGGLTISFGTGIPMLGNITYNLIGTPENFLTFFILTLLITAMFTWSACSGIGKGILVLSKLCIYISFVLVGYFLIFGHPIFEIENTVQSFGLSLENFSQMLFYLDPTRASGGFPQEWTIFYWAWWLGLAPVMWVFIAKCSAGRSIRSVILTVILAGTAGSVLFFGTISNYGLGEILLKGFDFNTIGSNGTFLDTFYNTGNQYGLVSDIITSLPLGKLVMVGWFTAGFILLVTTMDSASYSMAAACTKGLRTWDDPPKKLSVLWATMLSICPLCLLWAQADLSGFKAVLILTAIPVSLLILLCMITCAKWLKEDFGHMSKQEIVEYFMLDDEKQLYLEKRRKGQENPDTTITINEDNTTPSQAETSTAK